MAKTVLHSVQLRKDEGQRKRRPMQRKFGRGTHIMIKQFLAEEEGQTLVEYGLLISLIALVVIAVLTLLGSRIKATFNTAANSINTTTT